MQGLREDFKQYVAQGPTFEYSSIISSREDIEWLISQLPEKPKAIALLFSSSIHGWKYTDWAARCEGRSQIITLLKSTKGRTAGGYLHVKLKKEWNFWHGDDELFLFNLDSKMKHQPIYDEEIIYFQKEVGLCNFCLTLTA